MESKFHREVGLGTFRPHGNARKYIDDILDSGRISYGKYSRELESKFAKMHDSKFGVLSNSGTSSLQVALQAMKELYGWKDGDLVFVPSSTFVATINIVLHCRLTPILIDIKLDDFGMDPDGLEKTLNSYCNRLDENGLDGNLPVPRCIIPVHAFGQPCDMLNIMTIANDFELKVIEDSCESMFVENGDFGPFLPVGSMGHVGCFSFYVAHLVTAGVGGISITSDEDLAIKMRSLVNHGRDSIYMSIDDDDDVSRELVDKRFKFTSVGHSFRITEFESALALSQVEDSEYISNMLKVRGVNAQRLTDNICKNLQGKITPATKMKNRSHAWMMYPMLIEDENVDKLDLTTYLENAGIETRDLLPITNQPVYHDLLEIREWHYPNSKVLNDNGFYVACHQDLTEEDMDYITKKIEEFFNRSSK